MTDPESTETPPNDEVGGDSTPAAPEKPPGFRKKGKGSSPVKRSGLKIDRSAPLHQARVFAMQALFEDDLTEHGLDAILTRMRENEDEAVPESVAAHAARLARGVRSRQAEIDPHIEKAAPAYPMPQLASIDRAVLRVAVYELLFEPKVPFKAAINEAVEIAKRFGGPNSGRFVNGVLRTVSEGIAAARES
jgi:N utilization substance protein B